MQKKFQNYVQNQAQIESNERAIVALYEGALRFCGTALRAMDQKNFEASTHSISRAIAIFTELLNILDFERGGQVAQYLNGLYLHQIKALTNANATGNKKPVRDAMNVVSGLLEAWKEVHKIS